MEYEVVHLKVLLLYFINCTAVFVKKDRIRKISELRTRFTLMWIQIQLFTLLQIRNQLFTLMRIRIQLFMSARIRMLLLITVMRVRDHWYTSYRPSRAPFWAFTPSLYAGFIFEPPKFLNFDESSFSLQCGSGSSFHTNADPDPASIIMRIRTQVYSYSGTGLGIWPQSSIFEFESTTNCQQAAYSRSPWPSERPPASARRCTSGWRTGSLWARGRTRWDLWRLCSRRNSARIRPWGSCRPLPGY